VTQSMEKILSQNEIDALLRGVEDGQVNTDKEAAEAAGVVLYDFTNPNRSIRGRMPSLDMTNDHFCKSFRNTLTSVLRKVVEVSAKGVQMIRYGDFMKGLPVPSSLHVFKTNTLRGHALVVLESKLVFSLLDVFFGGSGRTSYKIEGRDFTAIESRFVQKIVTMVYGDFSKAWQSLGSLRIQHVRSEINPHFVSIVPTSELVLTLSFELELEKSIGTITFCIPYSLLDPIKDKLYAGFQSEPMEVDRAWMGSLLDCLKGAEVELSVELGERQMTVRDLLGLKVGDTIYLDKETSEPLLAKVEGIPKLVGKAGFYGKNKAIQIEGRTKPF
jgi:flagellar motor switch protein FliM